MKITRNVLFALLLLGVTAGAASAQLSVGAGVQAGPGGHASVDIGYFYDSLAPYGNWIERQGHGWVWTPRDVAASWRPYQAGHWVWSDQGWTWLTDEPYGWATYHYGRWYQDPEIGWAWVPGNDWAPAWVSWQEGKDYVGWAPLPPGANVNASYNAPPANKGYQGGNDDQGGYDNQGGYGNGPADDNNGPGYNNAPGYDDNANYDSEPVYQSAPGYDNGYAYGGGYGYSGGYGSYAYGIAPEAYLFVPTRSFLSIDLFDFFVPWVRVSSFWGYTRNCTDYGFYGGRYFNRGISFEHVHHFYRDVPRYRLSELGGFRGHGYQLDGNRLAFFRPQVNRNWHGSPLDRSGARGSVVSASKFRNDHPDRQRTYAQSNRQGIGRQGFGQNGQNDPRGYRQGNPSSRQAQGGQAWQRGDRNGQQWQGQNPNRQRGFENGRGQQTNRGPEIPFNNGQRGQQQNQANRQRAYDNPRGQVQAERQRQYNPRPQQEQYRPQQRSNDNGQRYQQRQAPPQRQQYRGNESRGQENRGQGNRGQSNRSQGNHSQNRGDHGDRRHGG